MHFTLVSMYLAGKYQLGHYLYVSYCRRNGTAILRGHPSHVKVCSFDPATFWVLYWANLAAVELITKVDLVFQGFLDTHS